MKQETITKVFIGFMAVFMVFELTHLSVLSPLFLSFYAFMIYVMGKQINLWGRLKYKLNTKLAKYKVRK